MTNILFNISLCFLFIAVLLLILVIAPMIDLVTLNASIDHRKSVVNGVWFDIKLYLSIFFAAIGILFLLLSTKYKKV